MAKPKEISTNFGDIPSLVLVDIFRRLPIASIFQCRRVCKSWYSCISSLDFANAYQCESPYPTLIDCNLFPEYNLLEFMDVNLSPKKLKIPPQISGEETRLVGSCNGFVCFVKCSKPCCKCEGVVDIVVGNPILGEYCLPSRPMLKKTVDNIQYESYGFGICLNTGKFKVLRMVALERRNEEFAEIQILTIGVDEDWRVLDCKIPIPKPLEDRRYSMGYRHRGHDFIYFAGAIYWLYEDDGTLDFIYSFDFSVECVRLLPPPPGFKDNNREKTLSVFKNCLCLVMLDLSHVAIWSIKQYGISESQSKDVHWRISIGNFTFRLYPIGVWSNGEMLLRLEKHSFVSYNPTTKQYKYIKIEGPMRGYIWCFPYSISFVRLRDALNVSKNKDLCLEFIDRASVGV